MSNALHPALIIGLGGSGIEIVRRFRRRLEQDYPDTPHVRFLGIDTDPQSQDRPEAPRLPDDLFYHAGGFNMQQYVSDRSIDNFPLIRAWWKGYQNLPSLFVATGAGQRRPIGRLALFVHFDNIKTAIERELRAMFSAESFAELPAAYRHSVTVYVVASTCGGTGTGMFLDLAFVTRTLVPQIVNLAQPIVRGLLIMPSVFTGTGRVPQNGSEALSANAYGALTEVDYFMNTKTRRTPLEYPTRTGPWRVERAEKKAFDSCFLLGNQDAEGAVFRQWGDLMERAAAHLQIDLASPLSHDGQSDLTNIENWMGALPQESGRECTYSSLNADTIELPSARIRARWTKRLANRLLDRLESAAAPSRGGVSANVQAELDQGVAYGWLHQLVHGDGYRRYLPQVDQHKAALLSVDTANPSAAGMVDAATNLQTQAARQLAKADIGQSVAEQVEKLPAEVDAGLQQVLSTGSLADAQRFLADVREALDRLAETVQDRRRKVDGGEWVQALAAAVRKEKGVLERKEAYARRLQEAAGRAAGEASLQWERTIWSKIGEALSELSALPLVRTHVDRRRGQLERIALLLGSVRPRIDRLPEPVVAPGMSAAIDDAEIDRAFDDPDRQERLEAFVRDHLGALIENEAPTADSLAAALLDASGSAVAAVASDFVASTDIRPGLVAERLSRLQPLAVFSQEWTALTLGGGVQEPRRLALLGVPHQMERRQADILTALPVQYRDTRIVPIGDDDQVLMINQHHGYPLFALAEMEICRRAFEVDAQGKELRFTLPEPEIRRWRIERAEAKQSNRWFAVALALGYVERVGTDYMYRQPTNSRPGHEHELVRGELDKAQARQKARDEFLRRGFASDFEANLIEEIRHLGGNDAVCTKLFGWVDAERERATRPGYAPEFREDLDAVAQYAEQLA